MPTSRGGRALKGFPIYTHTHTHTHTQEEAASELFRFQGTDGLRLPVRGVTMQHMWVASSSVCTSVSSLQVAAVQKI